MMRAEFLVLTSLNLLTIGRGKAIHSFAGPFVSYVDRYAMCDSDKPWRMQVFLRTSHYNPAKPYEKQLLTGNVTLSFPFDDSTVGRGRIDVRSNNQWKENAFVFNMPGGACSSFRANIPSFFTAMFHQPSGPSTIGKPCLVPRGVTILDKEPVFFSYPNFPVFVYGTYRFTLMVGPPEKTDACFYAEGRVVPKV